MPLLPHSSCSRLTPRASTARLPLLLARGSARFDASLLAVALLSGAGLSCGKDAEREYAGLSRATIERPEAGYVVRYLSPPWQRLTDDPLATGARTTVSIGGASRAIVAESGLVLEIERVSSSDVVDVLAFPKYRLEAALVPCSDDEVAESSCAEYLAELDYAARQEDAPFDRFGSSPRVRRNDWDQRYYELMGQAEATGRFRRVVYFEAAEQPEGIAGWLQLEANPDLGEREINELVRAVQMLPGAGAAP